MLLMGFSGLALILSLLGIYGVLSYTVAQQTHEIGIRMAIGAERKAVLQLVLQQTIVLTVSGLTVGLLASIGASRGLARVFPGGTYGDGRSDELSLMLVAAVIMAVTLLAAYIPARRASRINPTESLRCE